MSDFGRSLPVKIERNGIRPDVSAEDTFELVISDETVIIPNNGEHKSVNFR
jgi:hypothetical protein